MRQIAVFFCECFCGTESDTGGSENRRILCRIKVPLLVYRQRHISKAFGVVTMVRRRGKKECSQQS